MEELVEAKDPNTSSERLVELLRQGYPEVWEAVARNANTPLQTLLQLAEKQPKAVLENPVLPLLLLENPNVLHGLEPRAAVSILRVKPLPVWVAQTIVTHPDETVRWAIAGNQRTPKAVLEHLARDSDCRVRKYVANNPNTPKVALRGLAADSRAEVRLNVAPTQTRPCLS